jgi:LysM domain-containing protein
VTADESDAAKEDLWLTYQNYDPAVKQAVRRLGALPGNNVEEFRTLLLASRERSRVKEFEADVVRRLQGEAFVDDEVLQQTLIVLYAENPALAEQFKKFVAANGRPDDIDLAVARLRSGTDDPVMPERLPRKPRETPIMAQVIVPEPTPEVSAPEPAIPAADIRVPVRAPVEEKRPRPSSPPSPAVRPPVFADRPAARKSDDAQRASWPKYAALAAALLLIGAFGLFFLMPASVVPKPGDKQSFETTTVPLRQAAVEDRQPAAADPAKPAPDARNAVKIPPPPPSEPPAAAPPLREAAPDASPGNNSADNSANGPVPGSRYRVVKGDMLSAIALQAYGDASLFRLIQRANPELRNADHIYYDQMITLPPKP